MAKQKTPGARIGSDEFRGGGLETAAGNLRPKSGGLWYTDTHELHQYY